MHFKLYFEATKITFFLKITLILKQFLKFLGAQKSGRNHEIHAYKTHLLPMIVEFKCEHFYSAHILSKKKH